MFLGVVLLAFLMGPAFGRVPDCQSLLYLHAIHNDIGETARDGATYGTELMMHYPNRSMYNAVEPLRFLEETIQTFLKSSQKGIAWVINETGGVVAQGDLSIGGAVYNSAHEAKRLGQDDLIFDTPATLDALMVLRRLHYRHPELEKVLTELGLLEEGEELVWASNQELGNRSSRMMSSTNIELSTPPILARKGHDASARNFLLDWSLEALQKTGGVFSYEHSPMHVHIGIPPEIRSSKEKLGLFLGRLVTLTENLSLALNSTFRTSERENNRTAMTWAERAYDQRSFPQPSHFPLPAEAFEKFEKYLLTLLPHFYSIQTIEELKNVLPLIEANPPRGSDGDTRAVRSFLQEQLRNGKLEASLSLLLRQKWIERFKGQSVADKVFNQPAHVVLEVLNDFYKNEFSPLQIADDYRRQALNLAYALGKARTNRSGRPPPTIEFRFFPTDPNFQRNVWQVIIAELLVQTALSDEELSSFGYTRDLSIFIERKLGSTRAEEFQKLFLKSADQRKIAQINDSGG